MQGKVVWINPNNFEEIKVQFNINRIAIIELLGANLHIKNVLEGNFENLGSEKIV